MNIGRPEEPDTARRSRGERQLAFSDQLVDANVADVQDAGCIARLVERFDVTDLRLLKVRPHAPKIAARALCDKKSRTKCRVLWETTAMHALPFAGSRVSVWQS